MAYKIRQTGAELQAALDAVQNKTIYADATESEHGLMSAADKTKLDNIEGGGGSQVQSDWSEADSSSKAYIKNKPTIPAAQVQSNWNESDSSSKAYIQNKPTVYEKPSGGMYRDMYPDEMNYRRGGRYRNGGSYRDGGRYGY